MNLVCQQCKEPLQLDASLVDLAPSAYDMIVASLPPTPSSRGRYLTDAEKLAQLPSSPRAKLAWQNSKQVDKSGPPSPLSPRAQGKQPQRVYQPPNESFVLLQDSVIRSIPSPVPSPTGFKKGSAMKSRNSP
ncbi:hypothetical protein SERLA73DRAFT_88954, partial [Serpula lacrymans var. lacrymans S7.3]